MDSLCLVCQSTEQFPLYPGLLKCRQCGFVFANLQISEADLVEIYRKNYFFGEEYSDYLADRATLEKNFKLRLQVLMHFLDPARNRNLFEIGCAYGFFLGLARQFFEEVSGIDITEDGIRYCHERLGLNVQQGELLKIDLGTQQFDVVCLWDTIEHLPRPDLYLEKMERHMPIGGLLVLTTGDIGSFNARFKKEKWRLIHPPTHLQYFSRTTLAQLVGRLKFEIIYSQYCGFYRSIDNMFYNLFVLRRGWPKLYQWIKKTGLGRFNFYLNVYDIIYIIARKT